jgi:hypothetical protein
MTSGNKLAVVLIAVLGAGDFAAIPFMLAAHHHNPGQPPAAAIAAVAVIAIVTLVSAAGMAMGRRWATPMALASRILDMISALLGLRARPDVPLVTGAALTFTLSVAAIVLLARRSYPRRTAPEMALTPGAGAQPR